jgi:predicted RNA-binding Zn ribbon-like protein
MPPGTRVLHPSTGEPYTFDPGSFSMELLLTGGPGKYAKWEILHEPADLATWLTDSRLAATAPLRAADFRIRPGELRRVKQFRDTFLSVALALAAGERPRAADLEVVNFAAGPGPVPRLDPRTLTRGWHTPVTGAQVLGAAAADAIELVASARKSASSGRLRMCAAPDCLLLFVDTSRPGNRRWCSMQRCGNRNKVHAFRAKGS